MKYYCLIILFILAGFRCTVFSNNRELTALRDSVSSLQGELTRSMALYDDAVIMRNKALVMLAASGVCIIILIVGLVNIEKRAREYSIWASDQYKALSGHEQMLSKLGNESNLKKVLEHQIRVIRELITNYNENSGNIKIFIRHFREKILVNTPQDGFWSDLRIYTDINYNNIISKLEKEFPQLTSKDLNFIMLSCCEFSYIEIALCLGYANAKSISNCRIAIARKIGTEESLNKYLKHKIEEVTS